ncbi:hypothetical protein [Mesorhizobium sp. RIZ17]|uniref:hypothetical protein n=1 Tax=Mesorhizobium sp. RIZ17 TaxID=3132743 RepID=UPI003DA7CCA0
MVAGRQSGKVAHAIYSGCHLLNGIAAGLFVGVTGEGANIASARWLQAHHGDGIAVPGNNTHSVRELVAVPSSTVRISGEAAYVTGSQDLVDGVLTIA